MNHGLRTSLWRWWFERLWSVDEALHNAGITWTWLCHKVGQMEPRYFGTGA